MKIYYSGMHRCMGEAVETILNEDRLPLNVLSSYEWFRNHTKGKTDKGLRLISASYHLKNKGCEHGKDQQGTAPKTAGNRKARPVAKRNH